MAYCISVFTYSALRSQIDWCQNQSSSSFGKDIGVWPRFAPSPHKGKIVRMDPKPA